MWEAVGAIGSLGSMVLAGLAGYVAYRLFRVESKRDERLEKLAVEQQASSVGVWIDGGKLTVANLSTLPIYRVRIECRASEDRFLGIRPDWGTEHQRRVLAQWLAHYANIDIDEKNGSRWRAALSPGQVWEVDVTRIDWRGFDDWAVTKNWEDCGLGPEDLTLTPDRDDGLSVDVQIGLQLRRTYDIAVRVAFTDNARRTWRRDATGVLESRPSDHDLAAQWNDNDE